MSLHGYTRITKASPNVLPEVKQKIGELLKKPWNPYIQSALNAWNIN
jgi:hypothetical protein